MKEEIDQPHHHPSLPSHTVGHKRQRQRLKRFVAPHQVGAHRVDDEAQELVLFGQQDRHREVADLFFGVARRGHQVGRLAVAKLDVVAQHVDVEQLPDVLFLVVV